MKTNVKHVRANVKNLEQAIKWYENVLGFQVEAQWPPEQPNYVHFEHDGGAIFGLMESEHVPSYGRFNFYVKDVDELWEQINKKVEVVEELFDTAYGSRKFTVRDLDGNELGFVKDNL